MNERLLQFIWQFQYFNRGSLQTERSETLQVISPGAYNTHQGPDFLNGRIKVGDTTLAGNIELHVLTSDWIKHAHESDRLYNNVILHVVWKNDIALTDPLALRIPILELEPRVSTLLLQNYQDLMTTTSFIACEKNILQVREVVWTNWKERLLIERLQRKSAYVFELLKQNKFHWEETFWWLLARSFGGKVNADAFESIARQLPLSMIGKHRNQIHQLEALLFGMAGLLNNNFEEEYPKLLQREYNFHQKKYKIQQKPVSLFFLRMRPPGFPTVRLAQLAMLIHDSTHLFSKIKETDSVKNVKEWLTVTANDYWHYHYRFDEASAYSPKQLGDDTINHILINAVIPVLFSFGLHHDNVFHKQKALRWLESVEAENNSIINGWKKLGIGCQHAHDSQALIELKSQYCEPKRCLECAIGNAILKITPG